MRDGRWMFEKVKVDPSFPDISRGCECHTVPLGPSNKTRELEDGGKCCAWLVLGRRVLLANAVLSLGMLVSSTGCHRRPNPKCVPRR